MRHRSARPLMAMSLGTPAHVIHCVLELHRQGTLVRRGDPEQGGVETQASLDHDGQLVDGVGRGSRIRD